MPLLSLRYTSPGYLSSLNSIYSQILNLFSLLLSVSILMLLVISGADVEGSNPSTVLTVKIVTGLLVLLQLALLIISIVYLSFPSLTQYDTFLLTVAVTNRHGVVMTKYGATADSNVHESDISVFYQRVTTGFRSCEPLTLPLSGWIYPGQVLSFSLCLLLTVLHLNLLDDELKNLSLAVVAVLNLVQQTLLLGLTYLTSTDCGCCCLGFSVTRWFPHTDRYTQLVQSCVRQGFSETMRKPRGNKQWFNNTLVTETDTSAEEVNVDNNRRHSDVAEIRDWFKGSTVYSGEEGQQMDVEEQIKLLQNLLENIHDELYRSVITAQTSSLTPLFLTRKEIVILDKYFINKALENTAEHVIFQSGP